MTGIRRQLLIRLNLRSVQRTLAALVQVIGKLSPNLPSRANSIARMDVAPSSRTHEERLDQGSAQRKPGRRIQSRARCSVTWIAVSTMQLSTKSLRNTSR